VTLKTGLGYKH